MPIDVEDVPPSVIIASRKPHPSQDRGVIPSPLAIVTSSKIHRLSCGRDSADPQGGFEDIEKSVAVVITAVTPIPADFDHLAGGNASSHTRLDERTIPLIPE